MEAREGTGSDVNVAQCGVASRRIITGCHDYNSSYFSSLLSKEWQQKTKELCAPTVHLSPEGAAAAQGIVRDVVQCVEAVPSHPYVRG